ncbi:uncharacterized protein N7496_003699 [Penicillium cataractarum]|uniref:Uncharacterized protein n=1 Tax=Penicillium cataractarum TaxID=2100454 RepID=A0A9W9SMJ2_9EURO|nr:uncharacterized protein N7496_003699 [Penicillium cataractarum]KAJ5381271.1 hypothetical protein N7496_003699 [Penicillium cataractarum]
MTEGHAAPVADAPAAAAGDSTGAAPVAVDTRHHADNHVAQPQPQSLKEQDSTERLTPRPTFMENLASSRDAQFHLDRRDSSELERYFHGPRNMDKHSKWPIFMRMHGSVTPKMILPIFLVGSWATAITCICKWGHNIGVNNILLTVLGFVVGLALSFRSSTAYERWADGRKYWAQLIQTSRNLARTIWVNTGEREGEDGKVDLLRKVAAMNLILAFAVALKHKLRFEPDVAYEDIAGLVGHLDTFAREAHDREVLNPRPKSLWKSAGEYLGVSFAESNPRKLIKRSKKPLGHLPLEILNHLSAYIDSIVANGTLTSGLHQSQAIKPANKRSSRHDGYHERSPDRNRAGAGHPLPAAYSIAISQIAWIYVLVLPFQLYKSLEWVTIPASMVAAYIIIGLATIGSEIENPFGHDVNDLPLDTYCRQIAVEMDIITATPAPNVDDFMSRPENLVLFPLSQNSYGEWKARSKEDIRAALRAKVTANPSFNPALDGSDESTTVTSIAAQTKQSV